MLSRDDAIEKVDTRLVEVIMSVMFKLGACTTELSDSRETEVGKL